MSRRLSVFQALWAMEGITSPENVGDAFDRVSAAGFDGLALDLGALSWEQALACIPHFKRTGLRAGLTAFPKSDADLLAAIGLAQRIDAPFLVVIGQDMPVGVRHMVAVVERWLRLAESNGLPLQFETHRNCITNDLFATVELLRAVPSMWLAADLSHYVVDRELPAQPSEDMQCLFSEVLARSESFQGRIAARGQIQIPLDFPQNQKWVTLFRNWWREGFRQWRSRHAADQQNLIFLCELGPPDYALTDASGRELSNRWDEAQALKRWAHEIWQEAS